MLYALLFAVLLLGGIASIVAITLVLDAALEDWMLK